MPFDLATNPDGALIAGFTVFVLAALALDLFVLHRDAHVVGTREALSWTAVWVSLAVAFGFVLLAIKGSETALEYFTGYAIEYSLSMDNVFVFTLIFGAFAIPAQFQHRVLFWGVLGALVMRAVMILAGTALIERWGFILTLFGAFLIFTGFRMLRDREDHAPDPERNILVRVARRVLPVEGKVMDGRFFVRIGRRRAATPLFLALLAVEFSDLIFAVDSIPAIFAVTTDPLVVYTSNAFAILGLRSLYFLLADAARRFRYLSTGLAVILLFIGTKLVLAEWIHLPPFASLAVVLGVLGIALVASLRADRRERAAAGGAEA
jgi:tellurite resistance protein TerC